MQPRYYIIDSNGDEHSNLQLFALRQAQKQLRSLRWRVARGRLEQSEIHERCVFLICTIGLSVSQLLGQNNPTPTAERLPDPKTLFRMQMPGFPAGHVSQEQFEELIDAYDACRHFGLNLSGSKHEKVAQLTLARTEQLFEIGTRVWVAVIQSFQQHNQLEGEGRSADEIVRRLRQ